MLLNVSQRLLCSFMLCESNVLVYTFIHYYSTLTFIFFVCIQYFSGLPFFVYSQRSSIYSVNKTRLSFSYIYSIRYRIYMEKKFCTHQQQHTSFHFILISVSFPDLLGKQNIHLIRLLELLYKFLTLTKKLHTFCQVFT